MPIQLQFVDFGYSIWGVHLLFLCIGQVLSGLTTLAQQMAVRAAIHQRQRSLLVLKSSRSKSSRCRKMNFMEEKQYPPNVFSDSCILPNAHDNIKPLVPRNI